MSTLVSTLESSAEPLSGERTLLLRISVANGRRPGEQWGIRGALSCRESGRVIGRWVSDCALTVAQSALLWATVWEGWEGVTQHPDSEVQWETVLLEQAQPAESPSDPQVMVQRLMTNFPPSATNPSTGVQIRGAEPVLDPKQCLEVVRKGLARIRRGEDAGAVATRIEARFGATVRTVFLVSVETLLEEASRSKADRIRAEAEEVETHARRSRGRPALPAPPFEAPAPARETVPARRSATPAPARAARVVPPSPPSPPEPVAPATRAPDSPSGLPPLDAGEWDHLDPEARLEAMRHYASDLAVAARVRVAPEDADETALLAHINRIRAHRPEAAAAFEAREEEAARAAADREAREAEAFTASAADVAKLEATHARARREHARVQRALEARSRRAPTTPPEDDQARSRQEPTAPPEGDASDEGSLFEV